MSKTRTKRIITIICCVCIALSMLYTTINPVKAANKDNDEWLMFNEQEPSEGSEYSYLRFSHYSSGSNHWYKTNIHTAHNNTENKDYIAYCLDMASGSGGSRDNMLSEYTIVSFPDNETDRNAAKWAVLAGFGHHDITWLNKTYGLHLVNEYEARQATQIAIWAVERAADKNTDISNVLQSNYLGYALDTYPNSDALNAVEAIAKAGYNLWKNGISLDATSFVEKSKDDNYVTLQATITAVNCYDGYKATLTGLPTNTQISGSSNTTVAGNTITSTTVNGTDTITIKIPKTSSGVRNVSLNAISNFKVYPNASAILYAKYTGSKDYQNFQIVDPEATVTKTKVVTSNIDIPVTEGHIQVYKVSANPSITDSNACYSLKDAVYTIYTDKACKTVKTTITTKADGTTDAIKLETGTYYVKETTASKGYALDDKVHTVTVTINNTSDKPAVINSIENPLNDPNVISVRKQIQN